ncbi:MAG TPA: PSD1 and planctomycete cytochrome C domain-containing protein [Gemmataceae bacterium]
MTDRCGIRAILAWRVAPALALLTVSAAAAPARGPAAKTPQFKTDVLPILAAHCLKCHGDKKLKAKLDLRTPAGMLKGGESGPALTPGSADKSLIFEMIHKGEMPPGKSGKLTAEQIALVKAWIDGGAPAASVNPVVEEGRKIAEQDRKFWAFQKPIRPPVPRVRNGERVRTPIDAFVLAKLEAKGLTLSPDAERGVLLRRVFFDLIGLPPSPQELEAFLADTRPDAYERLVDRLLSSPHYGERWGRHWLDADGYADSIGGDNDPGQVFPREGMWRYRDYVIRALNDDKPFDHFLTEQLAGDEMDDWRSASVLTPQMREHLIATGFLRTTVDHTFEQELNRPFERYQVLHDTIENLTSNLLGLTVQCARCHDHKFDPIPQVEYYRLLAVLKPVYNPEKWIQPQNRHLDDVSAKEKEAINRHNDAIDRQVTELNQQIAVVRQPYEKKLLEAKLAALPQAIRTDTVTALQTPSEKRNAVQKYLAEKLGPSLKVVPEEVARSLGENDRVKVAEWQRTIAGLKGQRQSFGKIQAAWEPDEGVAPPTYVFRRGNLLTRGAEVQPGVFAVLTDPQSPILIPSTQTGVKKSGRRTAWARWLTRPDHPLTARVFVNRVWQHYFGEGIVAASDNFGHLGARPTHPKLLDWLATEFVQGGWKIKALHRLIVTSTVYRQSSSHLSGEDAIDPGNQLLGRMRLRRLESEAVRDAVLAVSGQLDRTLGGPPVPLEPRPDGMVVVPANGLPTATARWRRSLYLFARRNYNLTLLNVFDQPVMATNCTRRIHSAVPLQSLTLLNDAVMLEQADRFAARVAAVGDSEEKRIEAAFRLAFARKPTAKEVVSSTALLRKLRASYVGEKLPLDQAEIKALARLCHMLLCANEFLYVG